MNIKTFISSVLNIDERHDSIIKELDKLDSLNKITILDKQITPSFINYCNAYIPYLLKQMRMSDKELASILFSDTIYN